MGANSACVNVWAIFLGNPERPKDMGPGGDPGSVVGGGWKFILTSKWAPSSTCVIVGANPLGKTERPKGYQARGAPLECGGWWLEDEL